jgi:DNA polymerase I-like protein with 3'-5' exonuclease and polymerase domains
MKNPCYVITNNREPFEKQGWTAFKPLLVLDDLPPIIAYDCETTGLSFLVDKVTTIQIGTGKVNYLVDLQDHGTHPPIQLVDMIPYLGGKTLVGHNLAFDLVFMYHAGFYPTKIYDTMVASKVLLNGAPDYIRHSLQAVMLRELSVQLDKTERDTITSKFVTSLAALEYCFNDVDRLLELHDTLLSKLTVYGEVPFETIETYEINSQFILAMTYMEVCGIPFNKDKWEAKVRDSVKLSTEIQKTITKYIYDNLPKFRDNQLDLFTTGEHCKIKVQLSSPVQMLKVFKALGIPTLDDKGNNSTDIKIIGKSDHEFVNMWVTYKETEHSVTTFGYNISDRSVNNRLYTRFNPIVDTCRISSRKGEINFLNFPSDKITRSCFEADENHKVIVCDYSNQEARILADKTGNLESFLFIKEGKDMHSRLAREIYPEIKNLSDEEIKAKHNDKRQVGKVAGFAFAFGGNGYTVAKNLNIPVEEGDRIYQIYVELNKPTYIWGEEVLRNALRTGYISSTSGFKLALPFYNDYLSSKQVVDKMTRNDWTDYKRGKELYKLGKGHTNATDKRCLEFYNANSYNISQLAKAKAKYMRLCLNNPIQTTAAHMTKQSMIDLLEVIRTNNHLGIVKICNMPHDEIILEVPNDLASTYCNILGEVMVTAGNKFLVSDNIIMEADANIGQSWYEAK